MKELSANELHAVSGARISGGDPAYLARLIANSANGGMGSPAKAAVDTARAALYYSLPTTWRPASLKGNGAFWLASAGYDFS